METSRKRIIYFIEHQGIKPKYFLEKTGLSKGFIDRSHQKSGATDIHLSKILEAYPELNPEWLITGKGEMIRSDVDNTPLLAREPIAEYETSLKEKVVLMEKEIQLLEENKALQQKIIAQLEKELAEAKQKNKK